MKFSQNNHSTSEDIWVYSKRVVWGGGGCNTNLCTYAGGAGVIPIYVPMLGARV